ncbi:protoheme IX farnesyltransferase [Flavobacterium columnare NBRC 100251 = ATCC 23463]|uniref:Protoheme IX farnesyltransferase n=2 Tax=Flavobacterium columnare TaxID=996 RepID=G8X7N9_FLACA|nr:heme o synthase [Flavobacterium columnare]AEW85752.1 protoheme IX farnesyltransferase [Flavobacterium columnare ATCC 49512]AMO20792.2 protoheme IX farnesyltransferase [Flavobacterium columnare]ANO47308.1 protoheme IX farnesyltransferase [Flavobacterium columnare]MBF6653244.1 protoheme IX farnesyltransferase [Flavobacterium columnare]MBF6656481.1 protoheme IX farnesyltransferase [Flavobacterium columnare]
MSATHKISLSLKTFLFDFKEITKAGLAVSVVFSSLAGFMLGVDEINQNTVITLIMLTIGGYCMVGASNAYNQIIEKDLDALMDRTKNRPIPSGRMTVNRAFFIATVLAVLGVVVLYNINEKSAMFGAISIFLYTSVYTPMKTKTPLSVFVGAFPGAIPFMLGWVAATNEFGIEAGTLFLIQFFWQFPHFWSIGWFLFDDYKKGGFFMLPTGNRDKSTAMQTILYTIWLVVASVLPSFGYTGQLYLSSLSAVLVLGMGIWMLLYAVKLYQQQTPKAAKSLMLVSVTYISLLQIVYVLDKFLR